MSKIKNTTERETLTTTNTSDSTKPDSEALSAAATSDAARSVGGKPEPSTAKPKTTKSAGAKTVDGEPKTLNPVVAKPAQDNAKTVSVAADAAKPKTTKQEQVLTMLSQVGGVTIAEVMKATGWQQHSVRGFFAGTVRKKLGFELTSEKGKEDDRHYAIKVAA